MANGIIIIDKPQDWTSQDVTAKLRGVFATRRVGHGGTLDPMATGVLPVFVGRATRAVEFFTEAEKEYVACLRLGIVTDTQDITGNVRAQRETNLTAADVAAVLPRFLGKQLQIPPMYSAIKVGGKKLYELARAGKEVQRKPREIEIFALELLEARGQDFMLRIRCSKGTYVRTLCADIGEALGCGGCMAALRRTLAGDYGIEHAIPLDTLLREKLEGQDVERHLLPVDSMFAAYDSVTLTPGQEKKCRNGAPVLRSCPEGLLRVYSGEGEFLALGRGDGKRITTVKSFFEV